MAGEKPFTSNGTTSDPREQICWDIYVEKLLQGDDNAYQSAIEAKYGHDSARNITTRNWFKERLGKLRRKDMLSKAERNLDKVLDTSYVNEEGKISSDVMRIVVDVSKTVVTTLGKDDGYSSRSELTGKNGEKILVMPNELIDKNSDTNSSTK